MRRCLLLLLFVLLAMGREAACLAEDNSDTGVCFIAVTNGWFNICEFPTNNVRMLTKWKGVLVSAEVVDSLPKDDLIRIGGGKQQTGGEIGTPQEFGELIKPPPSFLRSSHRALPANIQETDPPFAVHTNDAGVVQIGFGSGAVFFVVDEIRDVSAMKPPTTNRYKHVVRIAPPPKRQMELRKLVEAQATSKK
jgi:hypothetical protein